MATRSYVCSNCQAITKRFEGALPPTVCAYCQGQAFTELGPEGARKISVPQADDERPCDRGEPCARLQGIPCPGGRSSC